MFIEQEFRNKPAILIATGPSLNEEVVETIRKYKNDYIIFGCNDSYTIVDFLDIHYACDRRWWEHHGKTLREMYPDLRCYTQAKDIAKDYNLSVVEGGRAPGLSIKPDFIHWGDNSGFQLLNLALLFGCNKFILVGYNMQITAGKSHFFGDHPQHFRSTSPYNKFITAFKTIQPSLKECIVNCTPDSALTMFQFNELEDELQCG